MTADFQVPSVWRLARRDAMMPLAGFLAAFGVFCWLFAAVVWVGHVYFRDNGVEVSGTVTKLHRYREGEWGVHVAYTEPGAGERTHIFETDGSRADLPAVGERVDFVVVPGGAIRHFQSDTGEVMAPVMAGAGALMLLCAVWVLVALRARARRVRRLLTHGVPVEAEVVTLRRDREDETGRIAYAYYLLSGEMFRGETRDRPLAEIGHLRQGSVLDILVDPDDPRESIWPPDALEATGGRWSGEIGAES